MSIGNISKSSRNEPITKYKLAFVTVVVLLLQSSAFVRLCNGPGSSAIAGSTAGIDILEWCVGRSEILPEFQIHPANYYASPSSLRVNSWKQ